MNDSIHFDGWTLLRSTGELTRGETRTRLQGQPLQVLEELLARPGELVTREQLTERLWPPGVIVDFDTALNSAVRRLRTALDDHAEHPRYIETIPRRGYRFVGQLETHSTSAEQSLHAAPPESSVALPVQQALDSARRGSRSRRSWSALGAAAVVGVATLASLSGWVAHRAGLAALTAAHEGDRPIAAEVRERFERARFFLDRRGPGDTGRALVLFEEALRTEPHFAAAWAGIASVRWIDTMEGRIARPEGLALTRHAAENALAEDPSNAEALLRLANYHWASGDRAAGDRALQQAAEVAPDDPLLLSIQAGEAALAGRFDEAISLQRKAVQHTPLATPTRHNLAILLYLAGRFDEARAELSQLSAISNTPARPDLVIGQSLLLAGNYLGALDFARTLPAGTARTQLEALTFYALGRRMEADQALQRLVAHTSPSQGYRVAEVHAYRGETDAAFQWLQRSVNADDAGQCPPDECWPVGWVPALPLLRPLHSDPRWSAMRTALTAPSAG
jgi:DNA-binding winged helix-turn-helix (wHTH) protein/tetratricopeptide (TPR) repeat protein